LAALAAENSALRDEVIINFNSLEDYQAFLDGVGDRKIKLLGNSDKFNSVRVGFDNFGDLFSELSVMDPESYDMETNFLVSLPGQPGIGNSPGAGDNAVAVGRDSLSVIGINDDNSDYGAGIKIAVIDSGIQEHETFNGKQIKEYDFVTDNNGNSLPTDPDNGHGTAVASIIGGADSRNPGIAPASELLSFRVLDNDGYTDSYTLAEAIVAATDAGADIINVSLGSKGDSGLVRRAVDYSISQGALIVAATGNEGVGSISYPAAIDGVVAVAANDAVGQHVDFANSGRNLENGGMSAPGFAVVAAWPEDEMISFSGTSASAPFVSGAVAAVMSENPGLTASSAYDLLIDYSNEAGAPGADIIYGSGTLNLGRVMERNVSGITDAAVASYYYESSGDAQDRAQVVVENRGTTALHNLTVEIGSGNNEQTYNISFVPPGEIAVVETSVGLPSLSQELGVKVSTEVRVNENLNQSDRNPQDNILNTVISDELAP
jgi:subtilisin family serine protease